MKTSVYLRNLAIFLSLLVISLPIVFAEEYSLQYDKNGNLIYNEKTDLYREYNELNQLVAIKQTDENGVTLQTFVWDPVEERVFIKNEYETDGSWKSSTYYFGHDYVVVENSSGIWNTSYVYQDRMLVGYEDERGNKRYVLTDHLGSTDVVLDETGAVIENNFNSPFGEPIIKGDTRYGYESREYDDTSKDIDFLFRKYDPELKRFSQPDTLIQNVYDPQLLNRFAFERNNPIKYTDEIGHWISEALDILDILTRYYATKVVGNENKKIYENQEYERLYAEYQSENQNLPADPYEYGLTKSGPHHAKIYKIRRMRIVELRAWKSNNEAKDPNRDLCDFADCPHLAWKKETESDEGYNSEENSDSPSTSNPSCQADSSKAISQSAQQAAPQSTGRYQAGVGYVTKTGRIYPTSNPNFVPSSEGGSGNKGSKCKATGDASCPD